jgi:hypothetical protein
VLFGIAVSVFFKVRDLPVLPFALDVLRPHRGFASTTGYIEHILRLA